MSMEPYLGEISIVGFNYAPVHWASCNGQTLGIQQNSALFSILGTYYGGNGQTTFALPDFRDKIPLHFDNTDSANYNYNLGTVGGQPNVGLSIAQLPLHNHSASNNGQVQAKTGTSANINNPAGSYFANNSAEGQRFTASPDVAMGSITEIITDNSGGNQPHENMQPFVAVNFIISLQGIFPTRI